MTKQGTRRAELEAERLAQDLNDVIDQYRAARREVENIAHAAGDDMEVCEAYEAARDAARALAADIDDMRQELAVRRVHLGRRS